MSNVKNWDSPFQTGDRVVLKGGMASELERERKAKLKEFPSSVNIRNFFDKLAAGKVGVITDTIGPVGVSAVGFDGDMTYGFTVVIREDLLSHVTALNTLAQRIDKE